MPGKPLDLDAINALLSGEDKHKAENLKVNREGPLGIVDLTTDKNGSQSENCTMCARGDSPYTKQVKTMYTVNGTPLCAPHAMYQMSKICVENGYEFTATAIVPQVKGML